MIKRAAAKVDTRERADLQAELVRKVLTLKNDPPAGIHDWKRYLARVLRNACVSWIRKWPAKEKKHVDIVESIEERERPRGRGIIPP